MPPKMKKKLMHAIAGVVEADDKAKIVKSSTSVSHADGEAPSAPSLPELEGDEIRYFELVHTGRVTELRSFLDARTSLNRDCVNCQGYTALHVAVRNKDLPMVRYLVSTGIRLKDTLLHSVQTGDVAMTEFLIREVSKTDQACEKRGYASSATYTMDISPVILAAQLGHWELVRFFLNRGAFVDPPHMASCMCSTCVKIMAMEGVNVSTRNLNTYKAISNPNYLLQVSPDPFLDVFMFVQNMIETSSVEEEFRIAYDEQIKALRSFACKLLDQCRSMNETRTIMEHKAGLEGNIAHLVFPRVVLALENNEREFVTHGFVQQVLRLEWEGDFQAWNRIPLHRKVVHFVTRFVTMPFIAIWINIRPDSTVAKHWSSPVSRYLNAFASHVLFIFFVYLEITLDKSRTSRGSPQTGLEWLIILWVVGYAFEEVVHCFVNGPRRYFKSLWSWYDVFTLLCFFLTFAFWLVAWVEVSQDPSGGSVPPRKDWSSTDSTLIHEALFAVSSVLSVFKLMYFFQESAKLGPLQVSLSCMMIEIARFLFICICVMFAFAFGLTRMYEPYAGMKRKDPDGDEVKQNHAFTTFGLSMKTLFLRMLGVASEDQSDVVVSNADDGSINSHGFTEFVGSAMYCIYQVIMLVAMVNSLIAIVTGTFQKIVDNAELHWKFFRTRLWMHYINDALIVPSPFLFLQMPFYLVSKLRKKGSWLSPRPPPPMAYSDVIKKLVQRYLCQNRVISYE